MQKLLLVLRNTDDGLDSRGRGVAHKVKRLDRFLKSDNFSLQMAKTLVHCNGCCAAGLMVLFLILVHYSEIQVNGDHVSCQQQFHLQIPAE